MVESTGCKKDKLCLTSKSYPELSFTEIDEKAIQLPRIFTDNFRRCLYPHYFMDIFLRHQYYYAAQVEDVREDCVIKTCFDIIGAIFKILTGLNEGLQCIGRVGRGPGKMNAPSYADPLPPLDDIQNMNSDERQKIFFKILKFDETLKQLLDFYPPSWHLYILALIYTKNKSKTKWPLKYALILSKITLGCIDYKIGLIRYEALLTQKYAKELTHPVETKDEVTEPKTISESLSNISILDSANYMKSLLKYFQVPCHSYFDRRLVHSITEFQTVLLHLKYLNNILQKPFTDCNISECLNCTFVYNFTVNLTNQVDIKHYLESLLSNSPNVLRTVYLIVDTLSEYESSALPLSNALEKLAI
nr:unnamed protein product [Callosobruchus analis]